MEMDSKALNEVLVGHSVDPPQLAVAQDSSDVYGTSSEALPLPGFLRLPAEVRNDIYLLCLPQDRRVSSDLRRIDKADRWAKRYPDGSMSEFGSRPGSVPALLQTCRTMRHDALQLYYSNNDFVLDVDDHPDRDPSPYNTAVSWLTAMDALALARIVHIRFTGTVRHSKLCKLIGDALPEGCEDLPKSTLHSWNMWIHSEKIQYEVHVDDGFGSCKPALSEWFASVVDRGKDFARRRTDKTISPEQKKVELIAAVRRLHDCLSAARHVPVKSASPLVAARLQTSTFRSVADTITARADPAASGWHIRRGFGVYRRANFGPLMSLVTFAMKAA
ncbi:hypothetical protein LTR56_005448 [Elasticomyces elasticus]|nr:hypothetical protein LTR22_015266 [Elasticomyces elasticus]KAK3651938.1 hypothetical protein LTR56_005448 [Elasticomyces elasticus]KAK4927833.1 hypothetical protein LTR49_005460 [Elasticomyces elasticus]KAK5750901.1 hypothetical protein LTS12_019045 [Elasticomyces elasticus]